MIKKTIATAILLLILFQGSAFAKGLKGDGDIVFRDALYGAAIGAIFASAMYLIDQDDFATKLGSGVAIGTLGGLFWGVYETRSFVEIKKDEIKIGLPMPVIQETNKETIYSLSILKADF